MSRAVTASMPYDCRNGGLKAIRGCCTNAYDRSSASCSVRPAKSITTSVRRRGEAGEGSCCCSKNREDRREDSSSCRLGNLGREPGAAAAAAMAAVVGPVPVPGPGASPREAIRTRSGCTAKYDANCCATSNCKAAPMASIFGTGLVGSRSKAMARRRSKRDDSGGVGKEGVGGEADGG